LNKRKICVVVTARPSYSRIKTALQAIKDHPELELQLVVAASALLDRYGNAVDFIQADGFSITEKVYNVLEGNTNTTMAKTTGLGIMELATAFDNLQPNIVCTVGDRYETMATAIAASYMNIPLCHIQGGEVTGNIDEKVRHAITKLADLHLVANQDAQERLIKLGEENNTIHITGCPSIDLAEEIRNSPNLDFSPCEKYGGVGPNISANQEYLVVLNHPVTTEFGEAFNQTDTLLKAIAKLNKPTYWFWPNVDAGSDGTSSAVRSFRETHQPQNMHFFKNMEGRDFLKLLANSACLIGNSSVGIRECSHLGIPVVNIGTRQNRRQRGQNVLDINYDEDQIMAAINSQISHGKYKAENIYGKGQSGLKIANILAQSNPKINKTITY
jgi:UDP-hydrolysing UDP-N-acetyl-D-glucosamine 2-epimerase